jgi:hypothetical protein
MSARPRDVTLTISLGPGNVPQVSPQDCDNSTATCVFKTRSVTWKPREAGRQWLVAFAKQSPFVRDVQVFSSTGPMGANVKGNPSLDEYKYWVIYADESGTLHVADPKLVIREGSATLGQRAQELAGGLSEAAEHTQSLLEAMQGLQAIAEELVVELVEREPSEVEAEDPD